MTHATYGTWLQVAGGVAVLALGLFVLSVRPRTRAGLAFATFALGFGGYFIANNGGGALHIDDDVRRFAQGPFYVAWTVGAVAMALHFPNPIERRERPSLVAAALVTLALTVGTLAASETPTSPSLWVQLVTGMASQSVLLGFLVLLCGRYLQAEDDVARRHMILTASALTLYVGLTAGYGSLANSGNGPLQAQGPELALAIAKLAVAVGTGLVWLVAGTRVARHVSWLTLGTVVLGLALSAFGPVVGAHGVARLLMTATLTYAVLQHQLLGLDVKVRWTIKKSTVAAVFIAVFFIASEGAQLLFGSGNEWVGLIAAGALVFALAPLQRAAERLAEKAVPSPPAPPAAVALPVAATAPASPANARAVAIYRAAVRAALRDGRVTRREELHLGEVAAHLELDAREAVRLRHEIEDEERPAGVDA